MSLLPSTQGIVERDDALQMSFAGTTDSKGYVRVPDVIWSQGFD